ncbi:MAG TPA: DUF2771 family protein [Pseudonocardia sp.]|nr:DUF2771 family protein [Pseudonocardia sp.]
MTRPTAVVLLALLLAGCGGESGEPPRVTFGAGSQSVVAGPTQYCNLEFTDCRNDAAAPVELPVPPGTALQVQVPEDIAETPWQVVFTYRDAAGAQADGRSAVFAAGERSEYPLQLPTAADRLLTAQVQQYGPPPEANPETGEIEFPIRASWVLRTSRL